MKIIAGPCSVDEQNISQIETICKFNTAKINPIYGVRVVGLKSRTEFADKASEMGLDFEAYKEALNFFISENKINLNIKFPSIEMAKRINDQYGVYIASEIMDPLIQLPMFANRIGDKFIPWNPAVSQLGWTIKNLGEYAKKYNWSIGIKNAKNLGSSVKQSEELNQEASMEKVWNGLSTYSGLNKEKTLMIHRGVDDENKGDYRSYPVHNLCLRMKEKYGLSFIFDPSHTFGPKMKNNIVDQTLEIMKIKTTSNEYLYSGILIEVGDSKTDTAQHITLSEFSNLIDKLSTFRVFQKA